MVMWTARIVLVVSRSFNQWNRIVSRSPSLVLTCKTLVLDHLLEPRDRICSERVHSKAYSAGVEPVSEHLLREGADLLLRAGSS